MNFIKSRILISLDKIFKTNIISILGKAKIFEANNCKITR